MIIQVKIVLNKCYGGFGLSEKAGQALLAKGWTLTSKDLSPKTLIQGDGKNYYLSSDDSDVRRDPDLVEVVETLGKEANGPSADLKVVLLDIQLDILEHDGKERVDGAGVWG